jgi:hypothetical protein
MHNHILVLLAFFMGVTAVEIADNGCDFFIHPKINPIDFRF